MVNPNIVFTDSENKMNVPITLQPFSEYVKLHNILYT